jgi:hypothetical protein
VKTAVQNRAQQNGWWGKMRLCGRLTDWAANDIFENNLYKTGSFGVLFGMSKKSVMLIALALVLTLTIVAVLLPPQPRIKKHGTRIHDENSISSISFTLTNNAATNQLPGSKP